MTLIVIQKGGSGAVKDKSINPNNDERRKKKTETKQPRDYPKYIKIDKITQVVSPGNGAEVFGNTAAKRQEIPKK